MRSLLPPVAVILGVLLAMPCYAGGLDDKTPDQQSIDALRLRASQASPREQCFLYAELLHQMTEYSLRLYSDGNLEKAGSLLKEVQQLARKIHLSLAEDNKRLKNAEILLRHTAFRLKEMMHSSAIDDQQLVASTLDEVNKVQTQTMMAVFRK
jgi:hypothetical protein